jgi:hypothetical protein
MNMQNGTEYGLGRQMFFSFWLSTASVKERTIGLDLPANLDNEA